MKAKLLFLLLATGLISCHSSRLTIQKLEQYPMESTLFAEVQLNKTDIIHLLNQKIDASLQAPIESGNIQMQVTRTGDLSIAIKNDALLYGLPVGIQAQVGSFAQATGTLHLWFKSEYEFHDDWNFSTKTEIDGFQWLEKPKAEVFGLRLPIEKLSNFALHQIGPKLAQTIDDQMATFSDFKPQIQAFLDSASTPVLVDTVHNLWLTGEPKRFGVAPFFDSGDALLSGLYSSIIFTVYPKKPQPQSLVLPKLEVHPFKKQKTHIHINGIFPADSLTRLIKEAMVGQEIPMGSKKIKIEDISIDFAGRLLRSKIKVSGAINGYIDGSGAPYMNKAHTRFMIDDFDVKLTGSNLLMRSGIKVFKKKIQKTLEESINLQIKTLSTEAIQKIQKEYASVGINSLIYLKVLPDKQILFNFETKEGALYLQISLDGQVQLNINSHGEL